MPSPCTTHSTRSARREQLTWTGVAREIWQLSSALNDQRTNGERHDQPIGPRPSPTWSGAPTSPASTPCSCCAGCESERPRASFTGAPVSRLTRRSPQAGPDRRLRWTLKGLYEALNTKRQLEELTWPALAIVLRCTPNQLTGLRTAKFATGMTLAMRITQWLDRPAADFVYAAKW